jgi:hypothetical protein
MSCSTNKIEHHTSDAAHNHRRQLRRHTGAMDLSVYRCQECRAWHVGNDVEKLNKRISAALKVGRRRSR